MQDAPTTATHVILGSGGAVGRPLARALAAYVTDVRCASRTPHVVPQGGANYSHVATDLLDASAVERAVAGAEVAYLVAGLPYRTDVWRRDWPRLIDNAIAACAKTGARLAFFDNVYALDPRSYGGMTEAAPLNPPSDKGAARAEVLGRLWRAHAEGRCEVTVARAADFYGPGIGNSLLLELVIKRLAAGRAAQWVGDVDVPHSFTYTPDAGRDLARLGNDARAWGQTWHLPTAHAPWTIREWTARAAELLGAKARVTRLPDWLWRGLGLLNADLRELRDVRAQVAGPYVFDSSRFEAAFGTRATPYPDGLREAVAAAKAS